MITEAGGNLGNKQQGSYGGGSYNNGSDLGRPNSDARQYNPNNDYLGGGGGYDRRGGGQNYGEGYGSSWSNGPRGGGTEVPHLAKMLIPWAVLV